MKRTHTKQTAATPLTEKQRALITAINGGVGDLRRLQEVSGYASISAVRHALEVLADTGHIVLLKSTLGRRVYTGVDFARGWDTAARLAGNPDA